MKAVSITFFMRDNIFCFGKMIPNDFLPKTGDYVVSMPVLVDTENMQVIRTPENEMLDIDYIIGRTFNIGQSEGDFINHTPIDWDKMRNAVSKLKLFE